MQYVINEGTVEIPDNFDDRSINVLMLPNPEQGDQLTLVITRDELEPGEVLEGCVKRQMTILSRQMRGFAELKRQQINVGPDKVPGIAVEAQNNHMGSKTHQLIAVFPITEKKILICALSSSKEFSDSHRLMLGTLLASYAPAETAQKA